MKKTAKKNGLSFPLIGDSKAAAMDAFGIAWGSPDKQPLPAPAVFVLGADSLVHFQYVNPNYRVRLADEVLLAAVRTAAKSKN